MSLCIRLSLVLIVLIIIFNSGAPAAASGWKPVTAEDLRLTSAAIGDSDADAAILFQEGILNDNDPEGTNLRVYIRIKIFNDRGRRHGEVKLPYRTGADMITDVKARTIKADGTIVEVEGRDIYDRLLLRTGHGTWRAKMFSMPAVQPGCIVEYRFRRTYLEGFRYFALDLQAELFIRELRYSIQPQARSRYNLKWSQFNTPERDKFEPQWKGSYNISAQDIQPYRREPLMPPEAAVKMWGWVYYSREAEKDPDKYWPKYTELIYEATEKETRPTGEIRRLVVLNTVSGESIKQKLTRIYEYVQKEIRYISRTDIQESTNKPYPANDNAEQTLRRRFGTSREINRLFVAMLRALGLDARVAELTTRDENFFCREFADPFQFNSEVTAVLVENGAVEFYDPGTPNCPLGLLSWEKENVQALVHGKGFIETPLTHAVNNVESQVLTVTPFADGRVSVKQEISIAGQRAISLRSELIDLSDLERNQQVARTIREVLPTATIDEATIKVADVANASSPLRLTCDFSVDGFAPRNETRLFLGPASLIHKDESLLQAPSRWNKLYFPYPWSERDRVVIEIPEGFSVERLPEPMEFDIGAASYKARFIQEGQTVVYERNLVVNAVIIRVEEYSTLKGFFDRVHQSDKTVVSFKR